MKERPILFSGPMVKAILDGTKTQTRRVMKPQAEQVKHPIWVVAIDEPLWFLSGYNGETYEYRCPYGLPGDRLYVRETFRHFGNLYRHGMVYEQVLYQTDDAAREIPYFHTGDGKINPPVRKWWNTGKYPWTTARYMPRRYSRIDLEITEVRVERVQEITEDDARAEGAKPCFWYTGGGRLPESEHRNLAGPGLKSQLEGTPATSWRNGFANLWDSINAKRGFGWDENPWVWVITFRRIRP